MLHYSHFILNGTAQMAQMKLRICQNVFFKNIVAILPVFNCGGCGCHNITVPSLYLNWSLAAIILR